MHLQRGQTLAVHGCAVNVANVVEDLQAIILGQGALGIDVCDDTTSLMGWTREITWGVTQCTVYRIWYFTLTWLFLPPVTMTPNGFFSIFTSMRIFLFGFMSAVAGSCGFSSSFLASARPENRRWTESGIDNPLADLPSFFFSTSSRSAFMDSSLLSVSSIMVTTPSARFNSPVACEEEG